MISAFDYIYCLFFNKSLISSNKIICSSFFSTFSISSSASFFLLNFSTTLIKKNIHIATITNIITDIIELVEECKILEDSIEQKETSDNDQEKEKNNQYFENQNIINNINEKPLIHKLEPKRTNH